MLTPFVLHTRPKHAPSFTKPISSSSMEFASTEAAEDEHYEEDNETIKLPQTQIVDKVNNNPFYIVFEILIDSFYPYNFSDFSYEMNEYLV